MVERVSIKNAIFGLFDGLTVVLGVIIGLYSHHPDLIFKTALGVGTAEALGMGAAEWLSESTKGLKGPTLIGLSTLIGTILPGLSFALFSASIAAWLSALIFLVSAIVIAMARMQEKKFVRSAIESVGILTVVSVVVWLISL